MAESSNNSETFLMETPEPISPPETELEMLCSSSNHAHSFHSSLLDNFQLDLELECEEDNLMSLDTNCSSFNSNLSVSTAAHLSLPIRNPNDIEIPRYDSQRIRNPVIAGLIQSDFKDHQKDIRNEVVVHHENLSLSPKPADERLDMSFQSSLAPLSPSITRGGNRGATTFFSPHLAFQPFITCPVCKIPFSSLMTLLSHFTDQHSKVKTELEGHQCCVTEQCHCLKKKHGKHKRSHSTVHKNEKVKLGLKNIGPFHCHSCSYVGNKKVLLQQHIKTKHNPNKATFVCKLCPFSCVQERSFRVHQLTHDGVEGKFACDQCGKLFFTMSILKRHARTHNTMSRPYVCHFDHCKRAFTIMSRLTDHLRTVHKTPKSSSQKRITVSEDNVDYQKQVVVLQGDDHNGAGAADNATVTSPAEELPVVLVPFSSGIQALTSSPGHMESMSNDDNEPTIVYDIILPPNGHGSIQSNNINKTKNLSAADIGQLLQQLSQVNMGNATKETSVQTKSNKKFQCSWPGCGKYFRDRYNLRKHMCTHTGEMENACPLCRYRCIQKSALGKHMKTHRNL